MGLRQEDGLRSSHSGFHSCIAVESKSLRRVAREGVAYTHKDDYARAIHDYDEALGLNPNDAIALYDRGLAFAHNNDLEHAIQEYGEALKLRPDFAPEVLHSRGVAYGQQKDYEHAIQDFDQALGRKPDFADALYHRGVARADCLHAWRDRRRAH